MGTKHLAAVAALSVLLAGCGRANFQEIEEVGHAAADLFASLDETGQGGGFASLAPALHRPDLSRGSLLDQAVDLVLPPAWAAACWTVRFTACQEGLRTKDFADCNLGLAKLSGSVELTFSDAACALSDAGQSVNRNANFTLTGRRNATLAVSSAGGGQKVTRTADGWLYAVPGMHRVAKNAAGAPLFDLSTRTLEDLVVTGFSRANRVVKSGKFEVKHNLAGYTVVYAPENLAWNGTCNCPVSGKLVGTATDASGTEAVSTIEVAGCGTGKVAVGEQTAEVTFDRCVGL